MYIPGKLLILVEKVLIFWKYSFMSLIFANIFGFAYRKTCVNAMKVISYALIA